MTPAASSGVTLDAGPLIALDRNERRQWAMLKELVRRGIVPVVPAPVVTEVWRTPRQANLGRALAHCTVEETDAVLARSAGELCGAFRSADPIDAIVVASAARRGDSIVTCDPRGLRRLVGHVDGVGIIPIG